MGERWHRVSFIACVYNATNEVRGEADIAASVLGGGG
jgi:hypothetical protein